MAADRGGDAPAGDSHAARRHSCLTLLNRFLGGKKMARRLAVSVGFTGSPEQNREVIKRIQIAEEVGVEAVFSAETWGRGQFSLLTQIALVTSKIKFGTVIAPVFGRSPAVLAMTSATLDELAGGRMVLGRGASRG